MNNRELKTFNDALDVAYNTNEVTYFKLGSDKPTKLSFKKLSYFQEWIDLLDDIDKVFLLIIEEIHWALLVNYLQILVHKQIWKYSKEIYIQEMVWE